MWKLKIHTEGRITAESCICSFIIIFILLLSIQLNGYIKAYSDILAELDKRLLDTALIYHSTETYFVDIISKMDVNSIENTRFIAVPNDYCFTLGMYASYKGVIKRNDIYVQTLSAKWSGDKIKKCEDNIWEMDPFERGEAIHAMMGANLDRDFPTLDIYNPYTREAISIISINAQDQSYQSGTDFKKKIKQQIDSINEYTYGNAGNQIIVNEDISYKTVIVVIPAVDLNRHQTNQINDMFEYANDLGIQLEIKKFQ
ncbi:MAG: hypothetical protein WC332_01810 [Clostridia bacterium]|jgi:hypothetical protein